MVNRASSDNLDNVLLAMSKMEYRDFVGINLKLARSLIKVMDTMKAMLEYEIKVRDIQTFDPQKHKPETSGVWP